MPSAAPMPRPHVAERRAMRHLVTHALDVEELRAVAAVRPPGVAASVGASPQNGWRDLVASAGRGLNRASRLLVTGPSALERAVLDVVTPLSLDAQAWDGRTSAKAPDLLIGALPWRYEEMGDVPDLPGPLTGPAAAVLPLSFGARSVTVGPVTLAGAACTRCVMPIVGDTAAPPDSAVAPALFAFAAGASGLFVRAFNAGNVAACSMSLTFDMAAPHIEHRLWTCAPTCRRAA